MGSGYKPVPRGQRIMPTHPRWWDYARVSRDAGCACQASSRSGKIKLKQHRLEYQVMAGRRIRTLVGWLAPINGPASASRAKGGDCSVSGHQTRGRFCSRLVSAICWRRASNLTLSRCPLRSRQHCLGWQHRPWRRPRPMKGRARLARRHPWSRAHRIGRMGPPYLPAAPSPAPRGTWAWGIGRLCRQCCAVHARTAASKQMPIDPDRTPSGRLRRLPRIHGDARCGSTVPA